MSSSSEQGKIHDHIKPPKFTDRKKARELERQLDLPKGLGYVKNPVEESKLDEFSDKYGYVIGSLTMSQEYVDIFIALCKPPEPIKDIS